MLRPWSPFIGSNLCKRWWFHQFLVQYLSVAEHFKLQQFLSNSQILFGLYIPFTVLYFSVGALKFWEFCVWSQSLNSSQLFLQGNNFLSENFEVWKLHCNCRSPLMPPWTAQLPNSKLWNRWWWWPPPPPLAPPQASSPPPQTRFTTMRDLVACWDKFDSCWCSCRQRWGRSSTKRLGLTKRSFQQWQHDIWHAMTFHDIPWHFSFDIHMTFDMTVGPDSTSTDTYDISTISLLLMDSVVI